jgi:geranylgeranyl diphosphate synthase type I
VGAGLARSVTATPTTTGATERAANVRCAILADVAATDRPRDASAVADVLAEARSAVDDVLAAFLADRRSELAALDPSSAALVDEIRRVVDAGGKRVRPLLCVLGARAAGPHDGSLGVRPTVVRAAAALELLHTFALIHDDVMDGSPTRRGVETTHVRFASGDPGERTGVAVAVLVGDLAAVLAEQLLRTCGAAGLELATALERFDRMRVEMAAGQYLDVIGGARDDARVAALKTSSYTVEGPLLVGTALAGAGPAVEGPLRVFGRHLGEAFQVRDDLVDGDLGAQAEPRLAALVEAAVDALVGAPLEPVAADALRAVAREVGAIR